MKENRKLLLILGSHAHVPSGSSEKEFEYAYDNIMRPFISNLYRYPNIQAVLHYSGVLLYWVERTHPEFFMLIEDMVTRKQAEIIGGGFYEPMFPIIPNQDRIGQIEFLTTYLRKHFGKRPQGAWIPAMAWEQNMAASLSSCDMQYTFLSQEQFTQAGITKIELFFPCITEDQGKIVTVFPVSKKIEEDLSEKSFSHVFIDFNNYIKENTINNDIIACVFPEKILKDAEESPDTAWNRFFEEISLSENIVETTLPSKVLRSLKINKKATFPNSTWIKYFSPRRYLIDNSEANGIYSKMIFTNVLISQLKGDKSRKQNAREELWKAQDSCLYMPANGINKNSLRKAAYSALLKAEQMSREKGKFISSLIQYDFDFDGNKEFLIQDARLNCYIKLKGACLFELDYLPKEWNYLDCGEDRLAFSDVLLPHGTSGSELKNGYMEGARLCFREQYDVLSQDRKGKSCFRLPAPAVNDNNIPLSSIEINKCYSLKKDILSASYQLKNTGREEISFCFVPEIVFSFAGETDDNVRFYAVDHGKDIQIENDKDVACTETLKILDVANEVQILIGSNIAFSLRLFSVCSDGQYQSTKILPIFNIAIEAGKSWSNEFSLKFSH